SSRMSPVAIHAPAGSGSSAAPIHSGQQAAVKPKSGEIATQPSAGLATTKLTSDAGTPKAARSQSGVFAKASPSPAAPSVAKPSPWRHPPKEPSLANTATTAELAVATPAELVRNPATAHPWPKWFWPGVATVLALSGLILAVRTVIHRGAEEQPAVAMNAEFSDSKKPAEGTIALVAPKESDSVTIEPSATNGDNPASSASG